ncbi:MAG TPA: protein kinase, partial [Kofleriaceae bacterium]|nr:protein kinase [Kofleriaceae bacterium]
MMGTTDRLEAGARIGDYVVDRELAAKPGLVAYSATHALLPRRTRIVCVHPAFAGLQTMSVKLMREACLLEALRHPGVPRVYECGLLADRRPWVATELIEGPTVASLLATEGPLSVPAVLGLLADIAEILHHVHARGCVHRNLRPEVIARRAEGPCILDWADARGQESEGWPLARPDTLEYQPPEVVA